MNRYGADRDSSKVYKRTASIWLRWLAILPASLLTALLVSFPIHWTVLLITSFDEEGTIGLGMIPAETLERLGLALFMPMIIVYVGGRIAPAHKFRTSGALVILLSIFLGAALMYSYPNYSGWGWIEFVAVAFLNVVGGLVGLYNLYLHVNRDWRK